MIRNWGIRNRVLLLALLPVISLGLVLGSYLIRIRVQDLKNSQTALGQTLADQLASASEYGVFSSNQQALQALVDAAVREPNVESVSISGRDGHILAAAVHAVPPGRGLMGDITQHIGAETGFKGALIFTSSISLQSVPTGEFGVLLEDRSQLAHIPSSLPTKLGTVIVKLSEERFAAHQAEVIMNSGIIALVCIALTLLLALAISGSVTSPIGRIIAMVRRFSGGEFDARVPEHSGGELGVLESDINALAANSQRSQQELQVQVDQATAELRETLEEMEIKNVELDLARRRALQASRVKSEFLANMSHEIRTPMNAVIGFSELLAKTPLNDGQRGYIGTIRQAAQTLLALLDDVLNVTRLEAGADRLQPEAFVLPALLEEVLGMLAVEAYAKGLELVLYVKDDVSMPLLGDRLKLTRIFTNLMSNAVKFTESGSVVTRVSVTGKNRRAISLEICVTDTGIGIHEDDQARLYQPFFQLDGSTRRRHGGAGLGLYISKKLLEQMGGTLTLNSVPGHGSEFRLALTLQLDSDEKQPAVAPVQHTPRRLLAYEAHPQAADALLARLRRAGWDARHLDTPAALEQEIRTAPRPFPYAAVVLSLGYTDLHGPAGPIDMLRDGEIQVPAVLLVNSVDASLQADLARRVDGVCLPKCVSETLLADELRNLMASAVATTETGPSPITRTLRLTELTVLVVDDNRINRMLTRILLEKHGATVFEANSGHAAMKLARHQKLDLVLLDMHMPGEDGWQIARQFRQQHHDETALPVIALSAAPKECSAEILAENGLMDWLLKPLEEAALLQALHRQLAPASAEDGSAVRGAGDAAATRLDEALAGLKPRIRAMLVEDLPVQWHAVCTAWRARELPRMMESMHTLNGTAAFCRLLALRELCNRMQQCLRAGELQELAGLMARAAIEVRRVLARLAAMRVTPGRTS